MNGNLSLHHGYCRLVNETILIIKEYFEGIIPAGRVEEDIYWKTKDLYNQVQALLICDRNDEVEKLLKEYLDFALDYFEQGNPGASYEMDRKTCRNTVLNSVQMMVNLTVLLEAMQFPPAVKVSEWFQLGKEWQVHRVCSGVEIPETVELIS